MTSEEEPSKFGNADIQRLSRKIERLLSLHPGRNLFGILMELSYIRFEFITFENMPNHLLEKHVDKAIAVSV